MSANRVEAGGGARRAARRACLLFLGACLGVVAARPTRAASNFPDIPTWVNVGAWQDSSSIFPFVCIGAFQGPLPDSVRRESRNLTVRFLRDRATEARPDFGGYRIYRMQNSPDSSKAVLIRRFSLNSGSELTWNASRVTKTSSVSILFNNSTGGLAPPIDVATGLSPSAIAVGDMNNDGKPDLVVANQGSNSVTELFSNGAGGLLGRAELNVGVPPADVALTDMNGDGKLDIVVSSASGRQLAVLPTNALGGFLSPFSTDVANGPSQLALADVSLDGRADYVVACGGSDTVAVVLGTASGSFGAKTFTSLPAGSRPSALALGDVTGDNVVDLVVANAGSNNVQILRGFGNGTFATILTRAVGTSPSGIVLRDVSGDANLDILVTNAGSNTVSVLLGDGLGGFTGAPDVATGTTPRGIETADMNGDAKLDLVVANQGSNDVSLLTGDGTGAFTAQATAPTGVAPIAVAAADVTGDGRPDVFTADFSYQLPYVCNSTVVNDSILTFVDPDSNGRFIKVCRQPGTETGRCATPGDSIFILVAPPGPHDGFLTWYSITIERRNTTDPDYEDLFVPDTLNSFARCTDPNNRNTCPNLNHKLRNLAGPAEPTSGPTPNLESVLAVPNPYRGSEVWDQPGQSEVHFINLPQQAKIRIYTAAGDLVRELMHNDKTRDFERWDLKNASGQSVASGIYMYRIESGLFHFQSRLVVIR
ncbi:MAG TPA: T9SS type A sorting domain-containing protein [Methylomirabilota bacterium]|nr:T9SS type A sorting domain-containing protein [Methylomirabilota bacterium]